MSIIKKTGLWQWSSIYITYDRGLYCIIVCGVRITIRLPNFLKSSLFCFLSSPKDKGKTNENQKV